MTLMSEALEHRRLRAPREDGGKLIDPPLTAVGDLVTQNRALSAAYDYDVQGRSLRSLATDARMQLVRAASEYTSTYRDVPRLSVGPTTSVFLAGHQPQLFHPGVWFKNFVLSGIAQEHQAVAVNLAIDSDTIKTASVRVPSGTPREPHLESIPYDRATAEIPYEQRAIVDRQCLSSFGRRASEAMRGLVDNPMVREFWPLVVDRAAQVDNLGECVAQARHQQEGQWGATTLELPQSQVCGLDAFHWFTCHLLARLPLLWDQYNQSVGDYRRANHVRSSAHPVPDLASEDDWLEAPFWIWDRENPRRRRLFVRQRGEEIILSDREQMTHTLWLSPEGEATKAAGQLAELAARGVCLRTRALLTTLFARLFLGDLFLHGIGGAKYDQVTDAIIERFFGLKPPSYLTLTATLRLPTPREEITAEDERRIERELRELTFHPERFLGTNVDAQADEIVREKQRWIHTPPTTDSAKRRCQMIRQANESLQGWVAPRREQLAAERTRVAAALRAQHILASREYAFCLYPADKLRQLMQSSPST